MRPVRGGTGAGRGAVMEGSRRVKGALLLARMKYVRSLGPTTARKVLDRLPAENRELLDGMHLLPAVWYPAEVLARLDAAIGAEVSPGDPAALRVDIGLFSAELNLGPGGVLRPYVREDDPHALLREVPRIHASIHGDVQRTYERVHDRLALVRTIEASGHEGDDCQTTVGWLRRAIELCGGRDVQVVETCCLGRGGECCEYRCEWR
jgi:hypothetical protein